MEDLRIVIGRPAKSFTAGHDGSWTALVVALQNLDAGAVMLRDGIPAEKVAKRLGSELWELGKKYLAYESERPAGITYWPITIQSADIYNSRNATLAPAGALTGKYPQSIYDWQPFNGAMDYTDILWIDSDVTFTTEDVLRLIAHEALIVSGMVCVNYDQYHFGYFVNEVEIKRITAAAGAEPQAGGNGMWYPGPFDEHIWLDLHKPDEHDLVEVDFCGGAFLRVKRGVCEAMEYPWYQTTLYNNFGRLIECSEDIGWCVRARELGYQVHIDPNVRVGHQKVVELRPPARVQPVAAEMPAKRAFEVLRA